MKSVHCWDWIFAFKRVLSLILLCWLGWVSAHTTSTHLLTLKVEGQRLSGQWDVTLADLDKVLTLNQDGDAEISNAELAASGQRARDYLLSHVKVTAAGRPCVLTDTQMQVGRPDKGAYLRLGLSGQCPVTPETLTLRNTLFSGDGDRHEGYLTLVSAGHTQTTVLTSDTPTTTLSLTAPNPWDVFWRFVRLGMTHIWAGLDHILFLLTLLLPSVLRLQGGRWTPAGTFPETLRSVIKVVTAFTVAHSVTLVLSALDLISLPGRLVEAVIAWSVVFAALNNLFPVLGERSRWGVALGFGLIHGFGFSSVLGELIEDPRSLTESLIGFNLGVELGQLAIVLVFVPVAFWLRDTVFYRRVVFAPLSAVVALVASVWFFQRLAG